MVRLFACLENQPVLPQVKSINCPNLSGICDDEAPGIVERNAASILQILVKCKPYSSKKLKSQLGVIVPALIGIV